MLTITSPYVQFTELDGSPLDDGSVYIGASGLNAETNPITVYWDNAGTQPASQPIKTRSGVIARNGAPARVYINAASYSLMVRDKQGRLVASELTISSSVDASGITDGTLTEVKLDAALAAKINGALQKSGGTMTGAIELPGNATSSLQAVPLQQLGSASAISFSALALSAMGINSNVSVTANEILLRATSGSAQVLSSISLTINTASTGANGLDTGTLSISTWYAVWVIWNGTTTAGLISLSATSPTMPSGYTHKARVGWIRTDGTVNKYPLSFLQLGRFVQYVVTASGNITSMRVMSSGVQGAVGTPTWVAVSVSAFVPPTASAINLVARTQNSNVSIAPNNSYGPNTSPTNPPPFSFSTTNLLFMSSTTLRLESANVYWASDSSAGSLYCLGWEDNL